MKKLNVKKVSYVAVPMLGLCFGIMIFQLRSSSSSRIILKDQVKIDKIILHNPVGTHDCHCFPPHVASNPGFSISKITATSASFRWVCDVPSTYQVNYGATASKGTKYPATRPTVLYTDYTVTVTGLTPNTTYHAGPIACAQERINQNKVCKTWLMENTAENDWTFKTLAGTAVLPENSMPPSSVIAISGVLTNKITTKQASLRWKTNVLSTSQVEYGTTTQYGLKSGENTDLTADHYIQLFDLKPATTYHYRVISKTSADKAPSYSSDFTLTTEAFEKKIADKENYFIEPNPCAKKVEFNYYLYQRIDNVTIDILTLSGKKVAVLGAPSSALNEGWNRISWDIKDPAGTPLINGLYVYIMKFAKGSTEVVFKRSQLMVRR
jgi:hypothetical protein